MRKFAVWNVIVFKQKETIIKKYQNMKKTFLTIMICIGFCTTLKAQMPPKPTENPSGNTVRGINKQYNPVPIAPATLLLLGLGASVTGYRIYRKTK